MHARGAVGLDRDRVGVPEASFPSMEAPRSVAISFWVKTPPTLRLFEVPEDSATATEVAWTVASITAVEDADRLIP